MRWTRFLLLCGTICICVTIAVLMLNRPQVLSRAHPGDFMLGVFIDLYDESIRSGKPTFPLNGEFDSSTDYVRSIFRRKLIHITSSLQGFSDYERFKPAYTSDPAHFHSENMAWYIVTRPSNQGTSPIPFAISRNVGFGPSSITPTNVVSLNSINGYVKPVNGFGTNYWVIITYDGRRVVFSDPPNKKLLKRLCDEDLSKYEVLPP